MKYSQKHGKNKALRNGHEKKFQLISPLALLALAACKGGNDGGGLGERSPASDPTGIDGVAIKGLLDNAFVFVDYNRNNVFDQDEEPSTFTDSEGRFSLNTIDLDAPVIVEGTTNTIDQSSGASATRIRWQ